MADELFIGQIPKGTEISIMTFTSAGDKVTITTQAVEGSKDYTALYVTPMQNREGKYYTFKNLAVTASVVLDGKIYFYSLDGLPIVKHKNKPTHCLVCKAPREATNRRENVRVRLSAEADLISKSQGVAMEAFMFDVSCSGIAVNVRGNMEFAVGTEILVNFKYNVKNSVELYKIAGKLVYYKYNEQSGYTKLGIWFTKEFPKVNALVSYVQREDLKKITHDRRADK